MVSVPDPKKCRPVACGCVGLINDPHTQRNGIRGETREGHRSAGRFPSAVFMTAGDGASSFEDK